MIGQSPAFRSTMKLLDRASQFDVTVLLEGETGTGKELAARYIHYRSARRDHPFIALNCGALPESLVANELFGHERGAFTDARGDYAGLLRLAHRGTLFLDEVDSLAPRAQVSLLRFLQDRRFRPLGSRREEFADVRVIAAANRSLEECAAKGEFRMDLYYRLKLVPLTLPPLRERPGDPQLLATHFLSECIKRYSRPNLRFDPATFDWLERYHWPGNIRELENLVHGQVLLSDADHIVLTPPENCMSSPADSSADAIAASDSLLPYMLAKAAARESFDRCYLDAVLKRAQGNITQAALIAGQERRALGKLIKKYALDPARYRERGEHSSN